MNHLYIVLLAWSFFSFEQTDPVTDSLEQVIEQSTTNSKKEALFLLGEHLVQRNPERAEEIADELNSNFINVKSKDEVARLRFIYAASHRWQGNYATALEYYEKNYTYYVENNDKINIAKSGHYIGTINTFLGNNVLSQQYLLEVAEIYDEIGTPKQKASIANSLAGLYLNIDQLEKGKDKYLVALNQFKELNDSAGIANTNANLGMVYTYLKNYDEAEKHLKEQKNYNAVFPTLREMGFHHDFMGNLRREQGRNQEAYQEHLKALNIRKGLSSTYNLCESRLNMGQILIDLERYDEAISQLKEVFSFEEHQSLNQQMRAHNLLAEANEKLGNYKLAIASYKSFKEISDSIYNNESIDIIAEKDAQYKKKEQDAEIALLNKEKEVNVAKLSRSRTIIWGSLAGLLLLGLFTFFAYQSNQKIKAQNAIISNALEEKELLMREIHHRVKNNLQTISSLLNLQSRYVKDESALDAIQKGRNRVQSMAILHKSLYSENDVTSVNMQEYFNNLIQSIFASYNLSENQVKLNLDVENVKLDVDSVIPIGLIINELITNSLKHAFTKSKELHAEIHVKLKESTENYELIVSDNGKGVSNEVLARQQEESFGQRMIRAFVQKLKAKIHVNNEAGTEVQILIPKLS